MIQSLEETSDYDRLSALNLTTLETIRKGEM